jgi:hypothetical protein
MATVEKVDGKQPAFSQGEWQRTAVLPPKCLDIPKTSKIFLMIRNIRVKNQFAILQIRPT